MEGRGFLRGGREGDCRGETEAASNKAWGGEGIEFHGRSGGGMRDGGPSVQEGEAAAIPPFFPSGRSPAS